MSAPVVPLFKLTTSSEVRPKGATLSDVAAWFVAEVLPNPALGIKPKTARNYRRTLDLALPWLGDHPSPDEVLKWTMVLALRPYDLGPRTVYHHWKNLRAIYRYGNDGSKVMGNPCAFMKLRQPDAAPRPIVNIASVWPVLLEAAEGARERAFLAVLRFAGLRRSEALGLMAEDVVRPRSGGPWWLHVERQRPAPNAWTTTPTKTSGSRRPVEVRPELRELLSEVVDLPGAEVRTGRGGGGRATVPFLFPFREENLRQLMKRLREVAPLSFPAGKAWHVLRDSFAVELDRAGVPLGDVSRLLGHASPITTTVHYFGSTSLHRRVPGAFDRLYEGQAPPGGGPGRSDPLPAGTGKGSRRSKAVQPAKESPPCSARGKRSTVQRSLPGLSVGPVTKRPRGRK